MQSAFNLPERPAKPRENGLTVIIDNGVPTAYFKDVLASHGNIIDYIKFGWGTCLVTKDISEKVEASKQAGIQALVGGTFFEKALFENKLDYYYNFCNEYGLECVEISNGTIDLKNEDKANYIRQFAKEFKVFSEVGYKDNERSQELPPSKWVEFINQDLEAGAYKVITEARETGRSGICRSDGQVRYGLITDILNGGVDMKDLIFEAPSKDLQTYFIKKLGPEVNLANIWLTDIIGVETLRLGLRSDTLFDISQYISDAK